MTMEGLYRTIALWVIAGGPSATGTKKRQQVLEKSRFELRTFVGGDCGRHTETSNPAGYESLSYRGGCRVWTGKGFGPSGESVHTC